MTDIEIVNLALSDCGAPLITTFGDGTASAQVANAKYVGTRDAVLEAREWTFAKSRALLVRDPVAPAFGYSYRFIIPSDVLRVPRIYDSADADASPLAGWIREGSFILTNTEVIYAELQKRVGEGMFSPTMVLALAARLTSVFAIPLTENRQLAKDSWDRYTDLLREAGALDGGQGTTQTLRPPNLPGRRASGL